MLKLTRKIEAPDFDFPAAHSSNRLGWNDSILLWRFAYGIHRRLQLKAFTLALDAQRALPA